MQDSELSKLQENYYQTMDSFDSKKPGRILVLGIGNYLMGDEGVGVHAIHTLSKIQLPDNVDIIDGATGSEAVENVLPKIAATVIDLIKRVNSGELLN